MQETLFQVGERNGHSRDYGKKYEIIIIETQNTTENTPKISDMMTTISTYISIII